jgi:hypothetical protein
MNLNIIKIILNLALFSLVTISVFSCGHQGSASLDAQHECKPYDEYSAAHNDGTETYVECQKRIWEGREYIK